MRVREGSAVSAQVASVGHAGEILILSGPPGSGKTTTSKILAAISGSPKVHVHADDFWGNIKHGALEPWLPEAHVQNTVVINTIASAVETYARGGYFVVLDGVIGAWFLDAFRSFRLPLHYVVLRPPLEVAIDRCRLRGGSQLSAEEPVAALHAQFAQLDALEGRVVETDGLDEQATLFRVVEALDSGNFRIDA